MTIEELQAQRIKELDESRNDLYARIKELEDTNKELENKLEVATDECVWFANKNHQLHADKEELEVTNKKLEYKNDVQNGILSKRLTAYIYLANFWFDQSLIGDKDEISKFDDLSGLRYEYMAEALYNILHIEQSPARLFKLLKRYNPDL